MDSRIIVNCDFCDVGALIPKNLYGVVCRSKECAGIVVFKPIENSKKYIRVICKNEPSYYWMEADATSILCKCCEAVYYITDDVVEIRNQQKIYNSKRKNVQEDQKKDSSAPDLVACKDLLKKNEVSLKQLRWKNAELHQMIEIERETKNQENEALKAENCSLAKKVEELEEKLKEKDDALEQIRSKIIDEDVHNEPDMKKLEMIMQERDELVNDKKKMQEQISSLIVVNVNLSAAVAKMTAVTAQKSEEKEVDDGEGEEELKEEQPKSLEEQNSQEDSLIVPCDFCGVKAEILKGQWGTICNDTNCPGKKTVIVGKIKEDHRLVRWMCKNVGIFAIVSNTKNTVTCHCCLKEYVIKDIVVEVRNNVKIYCAVPTTKPEDEIAELRNKLKNCEEQLEAEKKTMAEEVKKALSQTDDVEKVYLEELKKIEEQNKKLSQELEIVRKEKDEKEKNSVHLTEINTLLMKKLAEKGAAQ